MQNHALIASFECLSTSYCILLRNEKKKKKKKKNCWTFEDCCRITFDSN